MTQAGPPGGAQPWDAGQTPAFGQDPAAGQPGVPQPGVPQPFGQPAYPASGGFPPAGPPPVKKGNPAVLIGIVAAVVIAALAMGAFFLFRGSDDTDSSGRTFDTDGATAVARQYLDDVNAEDPDHARTLLCNMQKAGFDKNIQTESSDFSVEFTTITHVSTEKDGDQYNVVFDLEGHSRADEDETFELTIEFGVINEDGPKICAENVR